MTSRQTTYCDTLCVVKDRLVSCMLYIKSTITPLKDNLLGLGYFPNHVEYISLSWTSNAIWWKKLISQNRSKHFVIKENVEVIFAGKGVVCLCGGDTRGLGRRGVGFCHHYTFGCISVIPPFSIVMHATFTKAVHLHVFYLQCWLINSLIKTIW